MQTARHDGRRRHWIGLAILGALVLWFGAFAAGLNASAGSGNLRAESVVAAMLVPTVPIAYSATLSCDTRPAPCGSPASATHSAFCGAASCASPAVAPVADTPAAVALRHANAGYPSRLSAVVGGRGIGPSIPPPRAAA